MRWCGSDSRAYNSHNLEDWRFKSWLRIVLFVAWMCDALTSETIYFSYSLQTCSQGPSVIHSSKRLRNSTTFCQIKSQTVFQLQGREAIKFIMNYTVFGRTSLFCDMLKLFCDWAWAEYQTLLIYEQKAALTG